jgi:hypothetical protein
MQFIFMGVDVARVIACANKYHVPLEFNAKNLVKKHNHDPYTEILLEHAETLMVSSDMHTLADFANREIAFSFLRERGLLKDNP